MESLYQQRLTRYVTAMRNGKPDCVPIRPFVAEFTAKYAGYTCQEVTHDYEKAFAAARKCAADFDWDAVVGNMVYVWTGLTQAIGLKYYGVPGIDVPADTGFQYREPPQEQAFMRADEYDELIDDPTGFLLNVWLPRVAADVVPPGAARHRPQQPVVPQGRDGDAEVLHGLRAAGRAAAARIRHGLGHRRHPQGPVRHPRRQAARLHRADHGHVRAAGEGAGRLRGADAAPAARCGDVGADPQKQVPIGFWMHRGCVPFVSPGAVRVALLADAQADHRGALGARASDAVLRRGQLGPPPRPLRRAARREHRLSRRPGRHLRGPRRARPQVLPQRRHSERLLAYGTPDEVRACCKKVIDGVARDGGYIMDASAIMQNDARVENIRAMTEFTREYGVYSAGHSPGTAAAPRAAHAQPEREQSPGAAVAGPPPGVCIPWQDKRRELPGQISREDLVQRIWEDIDALGHMYIWHCLVSF